MKAIRRLTSNHCTRCARSISASPRLSNLRVKNKKSGGTRCETWRAARASAAFGDAANAYSYEITFADTGDGTPRLMRGAVAETVDEDGRKALSSYSMTGNILVCETRKSYESSSCASYFPTYETTETEATEGTLLRRTTRLTSNNAIIADERSTYDEKRRLRSTTYLDGTSLTNAYSCCRLLWSIDREGRKTLRSAETGTDHLYYADEDVWLADVSTNGAYRVTQHFFDALGRETNTIVSVGSTPGEATSSTWRSPFAASDPGSSSLASFSSFESRSSTRYPYGGSDYSISIDPRGASTVRRVDHIANGEETCEAIFTNGVEVSRMKNRSTFGGAISTRREWGKDNWTEQTRLADYDDAGRRVDYSITTSSDYGVVTNSVSTYDLLGRVVSTATPLGTTTYEYDGVTSRIAQSIFTAGDVRRVTAYLYNEQGELVGTTTDGVTSRSDVSYETDASNIVWRVTTSVKTTGAVTNNVRTTKTQLNRLDDGLHSRQIETPASGRTTRTETRFDSETQTLTTTAQTEDETPVVMTSKFGLQLQESSLDGAVEYAYDALGRVASERRLNTQGEVVQGVSTEYSSADDLVREVVDYGEDGVGVWSTEYDHFGRVVAEENALGNVVLIDSDALGRTVAKRGDTYPLRFGYDTQGRKTNSLTTRDAGATWDETRWEYDTASGLNTAKVYADGSRITYAYAADGKKTRTTWARGAWRKNAYNARRLVSGTTYSDETQSVTCEYDAAGRLSSAALANGDAYCYQRDERLLVTNEVVRIASNEFAVVRTYDVFRRARETTVVEDGVRYASKTRLYDSENRVFCYALTNAAGKGVSVALAYDGSLMTNKTVALPNGKMFAESLTRNASRHELVTHRGYSFDGRSIYPYSTDYDILGRPTNAVDSISSARAWVYNRRAELVAATLGTNGFNYAYDAIGNRLTATLNASTNTYSANNLNQYTSILCGSAALRETKTPAYDADGDLISDGSLSYAYDAENRLVSILPLSPTNGSFAVENRYDHRHRRTQKVVVRFVDGEWSAYSTHTYVWDGNNIILERIAFADGAERVCEYFWGTDKSGPEQGAGGVGGLLAVSIDGVFYLPCYDHNGNIIAYVSEAGDLAAQFVYDPYGNVIEQYGAQASQFSFGFSTKIHDREICLVSYQRRFYSPELGRWLNRDPIEEQGGENLYQAMKNNLVNFMDPFGLEVVAVMSSAPVNNECIMSHGSKYPRAATRIGGRLSFSCDTHCNSWQREGSY